MLSEKLSDICFIAFDIETSGSYPLTSEVCELAAVKFKNGEIVDKYQTLAKTKKPMSDFIISIHGITNAMVKNEMFIGEKIHEFYDFIKDGIPVAHHAPFDMGFLSIEFENRKLLPPVQPVLCTSLLARKLIPEAPNHKLQTLVSFLNIQKNTAHRALDDAESCLSVLKKCFDKIGWDKTLQEVIQIQGKEIKWPNFYMNVIQQNPAYSPILEAIRLSKKNRIILKFGKSTISENIQPYGFVRSPDGDFIFAFSEKEKKTKRYYVEKILESEIIES